MRILVINGPNLNMLGKRDPQKYGRVTLSEINKELKKQAKKLGCKLVFFQSNYEGAIIDFLQKDSSRAADGIIINPGALCRYAYSLRAALIDVGLPLVEVHLTNINKTGICTDVNVFNDVVTEKIIGLKEKGYFLALKRLIKHINKNEA